MKKKIAFVMPSFEGGGAERVTINIINNLNSEKFETVLIVGRKEGKLKEALNQSTKILDLKVKRMSQGLIGLVNIFRQEKPDLIFSVMGYVNLICMIANIALGNRFNLVLSEHSTVSVEYQKNENMMMKIQRKLKKILYPMAEAIVCVSKGVKEDLEGFLDVNLKNAKVLYNPILDKDYWDNLKPEEHEWFIEDNFILITAGRLVPEKGHIDLIYAMNNLVNIEKQNDIKLFILGEGPERERLNTLIEKHQLQDNVQLLGFRRNVKGFFVQSDVFVLSSLYEGLPTALIEAMGLKLPVISTNCPSGPEEIIQNEQQGILVPVGSPQNISEAILKLRNSPEIMETLKEQGYSRALDFKTDTIMADYEQMFEEIIDN